jgi:hypothetical protein
MSFRYRALTQNKTPEEIALLNTHTQNQTEWRQRALGKGPYNDLEGYDFARELARVLIKWRMVTASNPRPLLSHGFS